MEKLFDGLARKSGMVPGSVIHVGENHRGPVRVTMFNYDADHFDEVELGAIEEAFPLKDRKGVTWVNVEGVHDVAVIESLGQHLDLHPLLLEDIVHTEQRPKLEEYDEHSYIVIRMLYERRQLAVEDDSQLDIESEQVSMVLGSSWVLTFVEDPGDVFDPVRRRIRENKGRIRKQGADYLAYSLIDVIVDAYFAVLERFGDEVDELEAELIDDPKEQHVEEIRAMKRAMMLMRGAVWPVRDVVSGILRGDSKQFKKSTLVYLRDVYDHVNRVVDSVETVREMIAGMMDIYMSTVSNRLNEVMKVLTVIATIFIPLTFLVGVYGMNFQFMPELDWRYGYWVVWGVMVAIGGSLLVYFKRKGWF